jgi:hypothetical protein
VLAQDAAIVDAVLEDVGLDLVRGALPGLSKPLVAPDRGQLGRAIQATQHISLDET